LSIVLDMLAALLSGGLSTKDIDSDALKEVALSQVFIAIDPYKLGDSKDVEKLISDIKTHVGDTATSDPNVRARTPGEGLAQKRKENSELGIPIDDDVWQEIQNMI